MARHLTREQLRERQVPDEVIETYLSEHRVYVSDLSGVEVNGERVALLPPSDEVTQEEFTRRADELSEKIRAARRHFHKRVS